MSRTIIAFSVSSACLLLGHPPAAQGQPAPVVFSGQAFLLDGNPRVDTDISIEVRLRANRAVLVGKSKVDVKTGSFKIPIDVKRIPDGDRRVDVSFFGMRLTKWQSSAC